MNATNTDSGASAQLKGNGTVPDKKGRFSIMSREYKNGLIEGIKMFAWWKDGVQYVGTTGTTLEKALAEIEAEYGQKRPGISMKG